MSVSHLHPLLTLYAMSLVSEVSKSDIWDLGDGGGRPPILLQPRVLSLMLARMVVSMMTCAGYANNLANCNSRVHQYYYLLHEVNVFLQ